MPFELSRALAKRLSIFLRLLSWAIFLSVQTTNTVATIAWAQPEELRPLPGQAKEQWQTPQFDHNETNDQTEGSAQQSTSVPVFPEASDESRALIDGKKEPDANLRRLELRFGGSLCPTCLVYFEKKLYDTDGVRQVDMAISKKRPGQLAKEATATVDYDSSKVSKDELIDMVKRNDFQFIQAKDLSVK